MSVSSVASRKARSAYTKDIIAPDYNYENHKAYIFFSDNKEDLHIASVPVKKSRFYQKDIPYDDCISRCRLFGEFVGGKRKLEHHEWFGLGTNLIYKNKEQSYLVHNNILTIASFCDIIIIGYMQIETNTRREVITMSNFKMSPKYGANNSYHVCPWCGKKTGAYTSFGELPDDAKAPETIINSYDPCESCYMTWQKNVPVIEITAKQMAPGQPPINSNKDNPVYPTLRVVCLTLEAAKGLKMDTAEIGVPYLLGENRFSELFDGTIEANLREKLKKETDDIIAERMAEDAAKTNTND